MSKELSNKLVITAALAGAVTMKNQNPGVPYTPEEFAEEARKCREAGASIVHIHARNPENGLPTHDLEQIKAVIDAIKEKAPDILINLSSAISAVSTEKQRITPTRTFSPPLASLNSASMNFSVGNWKTGEVVLAPDHIFANTFKTIQRFAKYMKKAGTKPEIEIYDLGGLCNIKFLNIQEGLLDEPLHFQFVFGVLGGVPFSARNLSLFLDTIPPGSTWSVCGVASQQFQAGLCAAALDGHIRVGLEDNIRAITGELAKGSWEQVEWAAKVAEVAGREVATPDETRKILNLYQQ